jgi:hypothetical protein
VDTLQSLAQLVLETCPAGYAQARLKAELDQDWAEIDLRCIADDGTEVRSDLPGLSGPDLHDKLDEIRDQMAGSAGAKWSKCIFVIDRDGKFRMDVEYPD